MITLNELLGNDDAQWMADPDRNCNPRTEAPGAIGHTADLWFSGPQWQDAVAEKLCGGCPVLDSCAAYALARPELEGVWGATSEGERAAMRAGAVA